jgi:hypothetical protein
MHPRDLPTGSWIDCLNAIEKELHSLRRIQNDIRHGDAFEEKLSEHDVRVRFGYIWRYAGKAVKDLESSFSLKK